MPVEDWILHLNRHLPISMLLLTYVLLFEKITTKIKFFRMDSLYQESSASSLGRSLLCMHNDL